MIAPLRDSINNSNGVTTGCLTHTQTHMLAHTEYQPQETYMGNQGLGKVEMISFSRETLET